MIIYKTTNLINGKIYIGKSKYDDNKYLGSGKILRFAFRKYGRNNFKKEIIDTAETLEELNNKEMYWIKELNSIIPNGYNIARGGEGGDLLEYLPDMKVKRNAKFKESLGNRIWVNNGIETRFIKNDDLDLYFNNGYVLGRLYRASEETKKKLSAVHKGIKFTEEHKIKISNSNKGKHKEEPWNKGLKGVQVAWNKGMRAA